MPSVAWRGRAGLDVLVGWGGGSDFRGRGRYDDGLALAGQAGWQAGQLGYQARETPSYVGFKPDCCTTQQYLVSPRNEAVDWHGDVMDSLSCCWLPILDQQVHGGTKQCNSNDSQRHQPKPNTEHVLIR